MRREVRLSAFVLLVLVIAFRSAHTSWGGGNVHMALGSAVVALVGGGNGRTSLGAGIVRTAPGIRGVWWGVVWALGSVHICAGIRRHRTAGTVEVLVAHRRASRGSIDRGLGGSGSAV